MNKQEHLNRAKNLFDNGRFQTSVSRDFDRYELIDDSIKIHYDTRVLHPYFDQKTAQVVYAAADEHKRILYIIAFSRNDYFYDETSEFEWTDRHIYGFKDQNDD